MAGSHQTIERAAAILRLLSASQTDLGLGQVAISLGLAKGTVHGLLRTLQDVGFVEQNPQDSKYRIGADLAHLGSSHVDANDLRSRSLNYADSLAARTGFAVRVAHLSGLEAVVVHHVFSPDASQQHLEVGARYPVHACALGKILIAYNAGIAATVAASSLEARTFRTVVDARALAVQLTSARAVGWAIAIEELVVGETGIAAAIRAPGGLVVGAVGISAETSEICDARGVPHTGIPTEVISTARQISSNFDHLR